MKGVSISTTVFCPAGKPFVKLPEALEAISRAGYQQIELSRRHASEMLTPQMLAASGLSVWAIHGELLGGHSLDEALRRKSVEKETLYLRAMAPFAPCPYVIHYTHRVHDPRPGVAFRRSVEELLVVAEKMDIILAVETVPHKASNERYPDSREVAEFVRSFGSRHLQICVDVNHANLGEDLFAAIRNCRGLIAHVHVSDNHGVIEEHLPPGEGAIDLPRAMQELADAGYAGPLNFEFRTPDYPTHEQLVHARRWAEDVLRGLRESH